MILQTKVDKTHYQGKTFPTPIDPTKLNLDKYGIKLVPYVTNFEPNEPKCYREALYKNWVKDLQKKGAFVTLWKGQNHLTIGTREYAQQTPQGALLFPNEKLLPMFNAIFPDRTTRSKGVKHLQSLLRGERKDRSDGLLHLLNAREWNVEIVNLKTQKTIFKHEHLKEHEASIMLSKKMVELETRGHL